MGRRPRGGEAFVPQRGGGESLRSCWTHVACDQDAISAWGLPRIGRIACPIHSSSWALQSRGISPGQLAWKTRVGPSTRYKSVSWRVQKKVSKAWFPPVRIRRCVNPVLIPSAFLSALPCQPVGPARLSPGVLWRSLLCTNSYSKLWCVVEKFFAIRKMRRVLERKDVGLGAPARTRPSEQRS